MFYVAYRTLLVMFCVCKFYFVDFLWNVYIFSNMASENACASLQSQEKYYFSKQNITSNDMMFYRHNTCNKTFWYQFCKFKHFLKAGNSEDGLASPCVRPSKINNMLIVPALTDFWCLTNFFVICYFYKNSKKQRK